MSKPEPIELVVAVGEGDERAETESLARRVLEAWPERLPRPKIVLAAIGELDKVAGKADRVRRVVLARADGKAALRAIQRAGERIGQRIAGGVVLCAEQDAVVDHDTLMVEPQGTDPGSIAHTLATIIRQQPVVSRLAGELKMAQAMIRGVQKQLSGWDEEMRRAALVQREFMPPQPPAVDGLDIGVLYRPAGQVSGDIYDIRRLDDDTLGFFIADAVGHGMPAALHTLVISRSLRMIDGADGSTRVVPPGEALANLNKVMVEHPSQSQRFATAVYGVMDIPTRRVRLAGAGHPPALIVRPGGVDQVDSAGPLLGVFDETEFGETEFILDPGDALVIYSDGFEVAFPNTEGQRHELKLPTTTYLDHFAGVGQAGGSLSGFVDQLAVELDQQAGSLHQIDDVTAVLISPLDQAGHSRGPLNRAA